MLSIDEFMNEQKLNYEKEENAVEEKKKKKKNFLIFQIFRNLQKK